MQIIYKEIDSVLLEKMCAHYGNEELIRNHIHFENGSFSIAALDGDVPIGFISTYTEQLTTPLNGEKDAYISIIEVDENYRRQGIGSELVGRTEKWAEERGFSQIRAWSSQDKTEAIPMWRKLGYCMCPSKIWVEWCKEIVDGYYVVKKLNAAIQSKDYLRRHWYADIYDQKVIQDDVRHILATVGTAPLNILEVACGSGRISIPLAQAGHNVTGFDIDEYMLERIPKKANGVKNLNCYKANAISDDWGNGFDVVILSGNVLVNIITDGDYKQAQELFIKKAALCVKQGGHLYIDFDCVNWSDMSPEEEKEWVVFEGTDDIGTYGKFIVMSGEYDSKTRINKSDRRYEITPKDGEMFSHKTTIVKHFPTYEQVSLWLKKYGWEIEWHNPVSEDDFHAIIWAKKQ